MARIIQCPETFVESPFDRSATIFIGGGISGTGDWQTKCCDVLAKTLPANFALFNPRRSNFDITDPNMTEFQINWEYHHIHTASAMLFWFTPETMCPITLYELGKWSMTDKPLFVGTDPQYARQLDVVIQTQLIRPDVNVRDNIADVCVDVVRHYSPPTVMFGVSYNRGAEIKFARVNVPVKKLHPRDSILNLGFKIACHMNSVVDISTGKVLKSRGEYYDFKMCAYQSAPIKTIDEIQADLRRLSGP